MSTDRPLRFAVLGASQIVEEALLLPASEPMLRAHAVITVVASRRLVQAQALLKKLNSTHRVTVLK